MGLSKKGIRVKPNHTFVNAFRIGKPNKRYWITDKQLDRCCQNIAGLFDGRREDLIKMYLKHLQKNEVKKEPEPEVVEKDDDTREWIWMPEALLGECCENIINGEKDTVSIRN